MKKLFLSSNFHQVSSLLLPLLPKKPHKLSVAFIPTAADPYSEKSWMYEDRDALIEMGFNVVDIDLKNKTKEQLSEQIKDMDAIFVSGGNTYHLLEQVQKSRFNEVVKELMAKGIVYIGSSAGSVLACPTIEYIEDLDDRSKANLVSYKGIGLIDFLIVPHYGDLKYEGIFQKIMKKWSNKYKIQTLKNNQSVIVDNGTTKVIEV